jgi:hypothetical protein
MIALANDCLVFQLSSGENIPFSSEMISVELMGEAAEKFDAEFVKHAAASVFHHFKHDLGREMVSVAEFAGALEKILRGFGCTIDSDHNPAVPACPTETDLKYLAHESGEGCELVFFPLLRAALRVQLRRSPRLIRFHGLRGCVKQLTGARRWSPRCENMREHIVEYLRSCLSNEARKTDCSLVVE